MSAHALLIGVTSFSDPQLSGLRAPRSDVEALEAVLADPARGGFDEVVISIDEDLLTIRDKLSALLEDRHPDDMVLLYYSGHGIVDRGNSLFLATGETRAEKPRARSLPSSEVREMMEQSRAGRLVVVLDCCHSGVFTEGAKGKTAAMNDRTFDPGDGAEGVYVLTATNAIQYALDSGSATRDGVAAHPTLSHFTSWLLDGVGRGEAAPDKPVISLDDLYTYLCRRARQSGAPMTPQRYVKRNSGEMVIARNPAAQPSSIPEDLLARLDSLEWKARVDAVGELKDMVSKRATLRGPARKLLRDCISNERDRDVHEAMMACLVELDHKYEPAERRPRAPLISVQHIRVEDGTAPQLRDINVWEARVLARRKLEVASLSEADLAELPRCGRAWRNANWMLWGSATFAVMIVASSVLWGRRGIPWIWIAAFVGLIVGLSGLSRRLPIFMSPSLAGAADKLLSGRVEVLKTIYWDFERNLYRGACLILILACVVAAPLASYRRPEGVPYFV